MQLKEKEELRTAAVAEDIIGGKDEASVVRVRMYLVGKYATGKSSFVRSLLGEEFIENADSTDSISIHRSRLRMHLSSSTATGTHAAAQVLVDDSQHSFFANLLTARIRSSLDLVKKIKEAPEIPQPSAWFKLKKLATSLLPSTASSTFPTASATGTGASAAYSINNEFANVPHADELIKVAPDVISQVRSSVGNVDNSSNEVEAAYAFVELWDMGGQMPMLVQQSISFSVCDSVYIVTLDMRCDLDEEVTEDVYRFDGQEVVTCTPLPGMTQADYLHMCLSLIALQHRADTHTDQQQQQQQQQQPDTETGKNSSSNGSHHHDESSTAVMVVVTHVDLVDDNQMEKKKKLFFNAVSKLAERAGPKVKICGPFFVDNHRLQDRVSRHSQLAEAQQELSRIVSAFPVQAIPLMQVKIEEAISLHQKQMLRSAKAGCSDKQQQSFVSMVYPQFVDFCRHVSGKDLSRTQVSDLLHDLQQHGTVFCCDCPHPDTLSVIFLEPQQLLLSFVRLMTFPLKETAFPSTSATLVKDVKHFRCTGIASASLIERVWYPLSHVVQLALCKSMCYFNLAAELEPTSSTATSSTATSSTATSSTATSSTATSSTATSSTATSSTATSSTATSSTATSSTATSSTATSSTATSSTATSSTATNSTATSSTATSSSATSSTATSSTATSSTDTSTGACGSGVGSISSSSKNRSRQGRSLVVTPGLPDLFIPFCCNQEALRLVLEDDVPFKLPFNHLSFPGMLFPPPLFGRLVTYVIHRMKKESASLQFTSSAASLNLEVGCSQVCLCWTPTGVRLECAADTPSILADVAWHMKSAIVGFTQVLSSQGYQQFAVVAESFACTSTSCQDRLKECSSPAEVLVHSSWVLLTSLHKKHFLTAYESDSNTALTFKATCATCKERVIVPRSFWPWLRKDVPFVQAEPLAAPAAPAVPAIAVQATAVPPAVQATAVQATAVQATAVQATAVQPTAVQPTAVQATAVQATAVPATAVQATVQETAVRATAVPATAVQSTAVQATAVQETAVPMAAVQETAVPATAVPATAQATAVPPAVQATAAVSSSAVAAALPLSPSSSAAAAAAAVLAPSSSSSSSAAAALAPAEAVSCQRSTSPEKLAPEDGLAKVLQPELNTNQPYEDEKLYGDPFQQRDFLTDISPWLGKLPAGTFRLMAQEAGFFSDLQQIEDLNKIEERHGTRTHNEKLVNIVSSEEQAGYIKLVKLIKRWGNYPDKVNKMNQLLPRRVRV
ncbi:uncharacterized protein LOC135822888 isoform X2 [Sycon ciliatum]|uniref:uncharacterized protein LOC135822888 isoform X2 n=1 Tax=Sycon ciliatum TaxID=27933 RepID=UPI0031F6D058